MPGKRKVPPTGVAVPEEESFPRGGGSGLAPIVHKKIRNDVFQEVQAEEAGGPKKRRKHRKGREKPLEGEGQEGGDEEGNDMFDHQLLIQDQVPKYVPTLRPKTVTAGMKLLGIVIEIKTDRLIISLPHGLRGHVAVKEASDVLHEMTQTKGNAKNERQNDYSAMLTELFHVGQFVRCQVVEPDETNLQEEKEKSKKETPDVGGPDTRPNKNIHLSLRISVVNAGLTTESIVKGAVLPGYVMSVEDHGYLVSFGSKNSKQKVNLPKGFLPKSSVAKELAAGTLVDVCIVDAKSPAPPRLSMLPTPSTALTSDWPGLTIDSLLPGSLVNARVSHVLKDGLVVSFLTFFTGTIDAFHLGTGVIATDRFAKGQKLKARILYADPVSKSVGLTLQRHIVEGQEGDEGGLSKIPSLGSVFDTPVVARVDPGLGLLLNLANSSTTSSGSQDERAQGYVHISNLADERVDNMESRYRVGQIVKPCKVVGTRPIDGIAALSMRPSVVSQSIVSIADVNAGMDIEGTVVRVQEDMVLLAITPHLRAIVPALHMSDAISKKSYKKFKQGQKVKGRVLAVDQKTKRVAVTLKTMLRESKFPALTAPHQAVAGLRCHGVVTGVKDYGVYVTFYNDLSGLVPLSECGLPAGQTPQEAYSPGQVVKCRVLGVMKSKNTKNPDTKSLQLPRLKLSLLSKKQAALAVKAAEAAIDPWGGIRPGHCVTATVASLHRTDDGQLQYVLLEGLEGADASSTSVVGRLDVAHLSDHPAAAAALAEVLTVGTKLERLLVLERLDGRIGAKQVLSLTRKASLISTKGALPSEIGQVKEGMTLHGYVASVATDAVFVRFLNGLTGRAGLPQLSDTFVSDPSSLFTPGQSVRAQVASVDGPRFSLTLKRSLCGGQPLEYLACYFSDIALGARLDNDYDAGGGANQSEPECDYDNVFKIGTLVAARVHGAKDYGTLCDLDAHPDVVGLVAPHQTAELTGPESGGDEGAAGLAPGAPLTALVLDHNRKDGLIDLSLRPDLIELADKRAKGKKKKEKRAKKESHGEKKITAGPVAVGTTMQVTVQLSKQEEGYCVVSMPSDVEYEPKIGFLATADFASPPTSAAAMALQPKPGESITAKVIAMPGPETSNRLMLIPVNLFALEGEQGNKGKEKQMSSTKPKMRKTRFPPAGTITTVVVSAVHPLSMEVSLAEPPQLGGRIHVTEMAHDQKDTSPTKGSSLQAVVLGKTVGPSEESPFLVELSTRPEVIQLARECAGMDNAGAEFLTRHHEMTLVNWQVGKSSSRFLFPGSSLNGFVREVVDDYVWIVFSPAVSGRAFLPQCCDTIGECESWRQGKKVPVGMPVSATIVSVDPKKRVLDVVLGEKGEERKPEKGSLVLGTIISVGKGGGVLVRLGHDVLAKVDISDIHDDIVENAVVGLEVGQFVRGHVVDEEKKDGRLQIALSLKPSMGGYCDAHSLVVKKIDAARPAYDDDVTRLAPGDKCAGYVTNVSGAGVFVSLSRNIDARIKLRQLSDEFLEDPKTAFPVGKFVSGTVTAVDGGRIEMTLRRRRVAVQDVSSLHEGQIVHGRIKKVENYGVFVDLGGGLSGLAHVSQLTDGFVKDVAALFKPGQEVMARVMEVNTASGRVALGLKPSYFEGEDVEVLESDGGSGSEETGGDGPSWSEHDGEDDFEAELGAAVEREAELEDGNDDSDGDLDEQLLEMES